MSKNPRLYLVEDDKDCQLMVGRWLRGLYDISTANDGVEGLELLSQGDYTVGLTDYNMPKLDGIEMLEELDTSSLPPILMYTGFTECAVPGQEARIYQEAIRAGAAGVVNKNDFIGKDRDARDKFLQMLKELADNRRSPTLETYLRNKPWAQN